MIKITDLQIGDWILYGEVPRQITDILTHEDRQRITKPHVRVAPIQGGSGLGNFLRLDQIKALPLTPEMLMENGYTGTCIPAKPHKEAEFELRKQEEVPLTRNGRTETFILEIELYSCGSGLWSIQAGNCRILADSVHELQNFLRLAGSTTEFVLQNEYYEEPEW